MSWNTSFWNQQKNIMIWMFFSNTVAVFSTRKTIQPLPSHFEFSNYNVEGWILQPNDICYYQQWPNIWTKYTTPWAQLPLTFKGKGQALALNLKLRGPHSWRHRKEYNRWSCSDHAHAEIIVCPAPTQHHYPFTASLLSLHIVSQARILLRVGRQVS